MTTQQYNTLLTTVAKYRALAQENYTRIRALAEAIQPGFCAYWGASPSPCVLLVPPSGAFEPKGYGDKAFSIPPKGFQPLGPISFGLAVRVTEGGDWLRLTLTCRKEGDTFTVRIEGGDRHVFALPLKDQNLTAFFDLLRAHIMGWFERAITEYEVGDYGDRAIGFDFFPAEDEENATVTALA